jgi:sarcosine oxidase subunit beta
MELWHRIGDLVDDDCGFESHGHVKIAESEGELETLKARVATVRALGFTHEEVVDQRQLRELLPAVADHCIGGIWCGGDGAAQPYRTTVAFRRAAERAGAVIMEGVRVATLRREAGRWRVGTDDGSAHLAAAVVNCAGAWADRIAAAVGERVPLIPSAFMLMISNRQPAFVKPVVGATSRPLSFKQFANGTVMIGGGYKGELDRDSNWTALDFRGLAESARTVAELFPVMRGAHIIRAWAGIEARMPDDIPVIGPSATEENVFHAFGFSGHGFQLGPISGAIMAELVTTGRTNLPIEPFRIARF